MADPTAAAAKQYLQANEIPQLFEGIMTGLIHHKPANPIDFMEQALWKIRKEPNTKVAWDMFIRDPPALPSSAKAKLRRRVRKPTSSIDPDIDNEDEPSSSSIRTASKQSAKVTEQHSSISTPQPAMQETSGVDRPSSKRSASSARVNEVSINDDIDDGPIEKPDNKTRMRRNRSSPPSEKQVDGEENNTKKKVKKVKKVTKTVAPLESTENVENTSEGIPAVPVILFMGGPGVHKIRLAERAAAEFKDNGLIHICAPNLIRDAIRANKETSPAWRDAESKYEAGELISADLALDVIREAMLKDSPVAKAYLLEGFPRELQQVQDFESHIKNINLAIILDYDEDTLRNQMTKRGLKERLVNQRLQEYKMKTLPAAKFFDNKMLLHLIAGEQTEERILTQIRTLIRQALGMPTEIVEEQSIAEMPPTAPKPEASTTATTPASPSVPLSQLDLDVYSKGLPKDAPVILLVGAPGVSKNEYSKRICAKYDGFVHLSMGELLRTEIELRARKDTYWQSMEDKMRKGEYLPIAPCRKILYDAIQHHNKAWGYVIEGYPRTIEQAKDFEENIERVDLVLLIDVTETYALAKLKERIDKANRIDDTEMAGKARLSTFKVQTLRMLKYFEDKSKLKVVRAKPKAEGNKAYDEVFTDVSNIIDSTLFVDRSENQSLNSASNQKKSD